MSRSLRISDSGIFDCRIKALETLVESWENCIFKGVHGSCLRKQSQYKTNEDTIIEIVTQSNCTFFNFCWMTVSEWNSKTCKVSRFANYVHYQISIWFYRLKSVTLRLLFTKIWARFSSESWSISQPPTRRCKYLSPFMREALQTRFTTAYCVISCIWSRTWRRFRPFP